MQEYETLKRLVAEAEDDVDKAVGGNKAAGTRVRKKMQEIKSAAQDVRKKILEGRGGEAGAPARAPGDEQARAVTTQLAVTTVRWPGDCDGSRRRARPVRRRPRRQPPFTSCHAFLDRHAPTTPLRHLRHRPQQGPLRPGGDPAGQPPARGHGAPQRASSTSTPSAGEIIGYKDVRDDEFWVARPHPRPAAAAGRDHDRGGGPARRVLHRASSSAGKGSSASAAPTTSASASRSRPGAGCTSRARRPSQRHRRIECKVQGLVNGTLVFEATIIGTQVVNGLRDRP